MKISQRKWTAADGWTEHGKGHAKKAGLVLAFGATEVLRDERRYSEMKGFYPDAEIVMCSTAGEILGGEVNDGTIACTAIEFDKATIKTSMAGISGPTESADVGKKLADTLPKDGLRHALVFSDGLKVNGTSLVNGLAGVLKPFGVTVTGGLVGDSANFKETLVGLNAPPATGQIVLVGLYGDNLHIGYSSMGGWDPFGPNRTITKSKDNFLLELDGKPALDLYKEYLGDKAKELPGSGLLFPLSLTLHDEDGKEIQVVRTLLAIDEASHSMTFAGDMPEGVQARMMKANFERLIEGAGNAARAATTVLEGLKPELAILVSCVGRKLLLKERTEEEIDAVRNAVGNQAAITGFYSYGEVCPPDAKDMNCRLHNQTMTVTLITEE